MQRSQGTIRCGGPRTPSRTTVAKLDCVFVKNTVIFIIIQKFEGWGSSPPWPPLCYLLSMEESDIYYQPSSYHSNLLQHKNTITSTMIFYLFNIKHVLNIIHSTPSIYYLYMVDPRAFLFPCLWSWSSEMKNDFLNGFFSLGWASPFAPCFWRRRHNANKTHANSLAFSLSLQTLS